MRTRFLLSTFSLLLVVASFATTSLAQTSNGWGKGGNPKPSPTPSPGPLPGDPEWANVGSTWATGANWVGGTAPGDSTSNVAANQASFGSTGSSAVNPNVGVARSIGAISFLAGAFTYTISGATLTIGVGGITDSATNTETFSNQLNTSIAQTWTSNAGASLVLNGIVDLNPDAATGRTLTLSGAGNFTFGNTIQNSFAGSTGNLTWSGTGTLTLSGTNTYNGTTTLNSGTVAINNNSAFGGSAITLSNATLQAVNADRAINNNITYTATTNATVSGSQSLTLNGTWTDTASRTLTNNITSGKLLTLAGSVFLSNDNSTGSRVLTINGTGDTTISGVIANNNVGNTVAAGLTYSGAGTLTLSGNNTYSGTTTVSSGTLRATTNASALGTGSLTLSGGTLDLANDTGLNFGRNTTVNGTATIASDRLTSGTGVTHTLGTLSIGASDILNITVGTNVTSGTAGVTFGATTLSAATPIFDVASGANLTLGALSGNFAFTKQGAGGLTLNSASARSNGTVTLTAGTMTLGSVSALGTTGVPLQLNGGTLDLATDTSVNAYNTTVGGDTTILSDKATANSSGITHTLGQLNIATETLTIDAGANVGSGTAGITFGATNLGLASQTSSTTVFDVASGSSLTFTGQMDRTGAGSGDTSVIFEGAGDTTVSGKIANIGNGTLTKEGTGTLTLSGNTNSYTGSTTVNAGTLTLDYSTQNNTKLSDTSALILGGGTVNLSGGSHTEVVASTTINAGASSVTRSSGTSVLRMNVITHNPGGTIDFGAASIADTDTTNTNGILGPWATVSGTAFAINSTNGLNGPITALSSYGQTVTRLSSGTKSIANTAANNVQITDGTGTAGDITLAAATTTINTLTNSAPGTTSPAGGVTIDPAGQTLRVGGILNASGSSALTIGNGTNNGTLAANAAGGELVLQNFSTNALTVNSVIANNTSASSLTTSGTGTTVLTAANTYTGSTFVSDGTLLVNNTTGSGTGTGAVTVNGSGTVLGGTGTISGAVTVNAYATLQGGTGTTGATQKLTLSGNLTLADNSIIQLALGPSGAHSTLARTGAGSWSFDSNQAFTFINLGATNGTYDNIITGLASDPGTESGWTITNSGFVGTFTYDGTGNIDLNVTAVPEPSTWIVGGLAFVAVLYTQRRRFARKALAEIGTL